MSGYSVNIEEKTLENLNFREVLFTSSHSQLVVMTLKPGEDIGLEIHDDHDQFLRIEAGTGEAVLDDKTIAVKDGSAIVVPAGVSHNVTNTSQSELLKLYTIYSPAEHPDKTIHKTKAEADVYELEHHA